MQHTCLSCKKEFISRKSISKYCSRRCFFNRNEHITKRKCLVCSKALITYPNWIKRGGGKFCSQKCYGLFNQKRINKSCKFCRSKFTVNSAKNKYNASKFCSPKCGQLASRGKKKPSIQGEKAPNWRGGIQFHPYPFCFNDSLKESIRKRDNYECQVCGLQDEEHILIHGTSLDVHHIDYVKTNCDKSNLISLCDQCHGRTNYNRDHWKDYFLQKKSLQKETCR